MNSWNYQEYLESVKQDMKFGMETRQYGIEEAFGFAYEELLSRLEEFPNETPLALTALAVCLNEHKMLNIFSTEDEFFQEISHVYKSEQFSIARNKLDTVQAQAFDSDVKAVKGVLGI